MRRASGLAFTRSPDAGVGAGVGAAALGASAFGSSFGASAFASGFGASALASSFGASAFGLPPDEAAADASSPSSARIAMTVPTFTLSVPSATRILAITPSSTASNSIVALSVSISAIRSPDDTVSPSLTSHLASVPSSIVGDSAGILISIDMRFLQWFPGDALSRCLFPLGQGWRDLRGRGFHATYRWRHWGN